MLAIPDLLLRSAAALRGAFPTRLAIGLATLLAAQVAVANSFVSIDANTRASYSSSWDPANVGAISDSFQSGQIQAASIARNLTADKSGILASSSAALDAISELGRLHLRVIGQSALVAGFDPGAHPNTLGATSGFANLQWQDTFTITSSTLSPGTPVELIVQLVLTGNVDQVGQEEPDRQVLAGLSSPSGISIRHDVVVVGPISELGSQQFSTAVGNSFTIQGFLQVNGLTRAFYSSDPVTGGLEPVSELDIDCFDTAVFRVRVVTPDADYETGSGARYPTIPEPVPALPLWSQLVLAGCMIATSLRLARAGGRLRGPPGPDCRSHTAPRRRAEPDE